MTPALARRPVRDRRDPRPRARSVGQLPRSGSFTPYTAILNVTGQPGDLAAAVSRRRRAADRRPADRAAGARGAAAGARDAARAGAAVGRPPAGAGAPRRLADPEHRAASARGATPRRSASAVPRRDSHRHLEQLRLVPGRERRRARSSSTSFSSAPRDGASGSPTTGRRRRRDRSDGLDDLAVGQRSPARRARSARRPSAARSSAASTHSATSSAQIG